MTTNISTQFKRKQEEQENARQRVGLRSPDTLYALDTSPSTPRSLSSAVQKTQGTSLSARSGGWCRRNRRNLDPLALFVKQITGRLNKITVDNFPILAGQLEEVFDSQVTTTEQLTILVTLIFEKTVQEHIYGPLYANLCATLSSKDKVFDDAATGHSVDFKIVLVRVCQSEFQKGKRRAVFTDDMDALEREIEAIKTKKILLGTMKFIGHLYLCQLLPPRVLTLCLKHLIAPHGGNPSSDDLECGCALLCTAGSALDGEQNVDHGEVNRYYRRLSTISRSGRHSARIRIIIQNLLRLRKKEWDDPRALRAEEPKKLVRAPRRICSATDHDELIGTEYASMVPIAARYRNSGGQSERTNRRRNPRPKSGNRRRLLLQTEDE